MRFKVLYKVHNVGDINDDERYGRLLYNPGEQYPVLTNSGIPELWPADYDMEKLEYWFMAINAAYHDLNDYELIGIEVHVNRRKPGIAKGKIEMSDDFDDPLEDFKDYT